LLGKTGIISGCFSITAGNHPFFSITARALFSFSLTAGGITFSVGTISHHFNVIVAGKRSPTTAGTLLFSIVVSNEGSFLVISCFSCGTISVFSLGTTSQPVGAGSCFNLKTTDQSSLTIFSTLQLYTSFNALYDASAFSAFHAQNSIALHASRINCSANSTSIFDNSLALAVGSSIFNAFSYLAFISGCFLKNLSTLNLCHFLISNFHFGYHHCSYLFFDIVSAN
jgi:hypothetical protein